MLFRSVSQSRYAPSVGTQSASMPTISGTTANYSKTKAESWNWTDSSGEMHSSGYNSYQTDFPDLTGWLNQNNNSGKKAGSNTVDALSGADHKAKSGKVPNLNPMNKYINGGKCYMLFYSFSDFLCPCVSFSL